MTSCCDTYCGDYDLPKVYSKSNVKARKPHECCECHRTIPAGALYWLIEGLWDGHWERYRTCALCEAVAGDRMPCGYVFGELWEAVRECLRDDRDRDNDWLDPPTEPIEVTR